MRGQEQQGHCLRENPSPICLREPPDPRRRLSHYLMWHRVSSKSARVVVVYLTTSLQGQDFGCKHQAQWQHLKNGGFFMSLHGLFSSHIGDIWHGEVPFSRQGEVVSCRLRGERAKSGLMRCSGQQGTERSRRWPCAEVHPVSYRAGHGDFLASSGV